MEDSLCTVRDILVKWQTLTGQHGLLYSLFTDNHDNPPFISRAGNDKELRYESATCIATMFYLLKGVPFIYQGQEFGITSSSYDDMSYFDDVESFDMFNRLVKQGYSREEAVQKINFGGRDNARRPVPWSNGVGGGFSEAKTWIPLSTRVNEINLENDLASEKSIFRFYKDLLSLRKGSKAFINGEFAAVSKNEDKYFVFTRIFEDEKFTVVCNFECEADIDCTEFGTLVLSNYKDRFGTEKLFRPYEIAVYKG